VGEVTDNTSADFGLIVGVDKAGLPLLSGSPMAITAISGQLYSLKLDSTGHLIIVGSNKGVGGTGGYIGLGTQGYVLRYSKQGTGTVGFGTTGVITDTTVTGYYDVVIGPGDSIYAVGGDSAQKVVVRAIASNGSAVGTFGSSGVVRADAGPYASGREAVMANSELVLGLVDFTMTSYGPLLVGAMPLNGNGLAASYADAGLAQPPLSTYDRYYNFHTIAAQCDGRVLVGGRADLSDGGQRVALTRYLTSGSADTTFGSGGTVYVDDGTGLVIPIGIAQDPISGKIILLGQNGTTGQFLLRLEP
jgi:hypothetical protein